MRLNAEENGPQWANEQDSRCTHVGQFLRRTRLDELPQLYNILRGDMSFVGPRPERAYFYRKFETYIPGFSNRLMVVPGLTGYAQVNGGYSLKPEEKIVYDMEYIENAPFGWIRSASSRPYMSYLMAAAPGKKRDSEEIPVHE